MLSQKWKPNQSAPLWQGNDGPWFHDMELEHIKQVGPSCVPTTLAMLANAAGGDVSVEKMKLLINTQAPHTWSNALKKFGMQLAYCNNDQRELCHYIEELVRMDDLFLLSFYSSQPPRHPDQNGKLCTAHIVTMCRDEIIDTAKWEGTISAENYPRNGNITKRRFRVVPLGHERCL